MWTSFATSTVYATLTFWHKLYYVICQSNDWLMVVFTEMIIIVNAQFIVQYKCCLVHAMPMGRLIYYSWTLYKRHWCKKQMSIKGTRVPTLKPRLIRKCIHGTLLIRNNSYKKQELLFDACFLTRGSTVVHKACTGPWIPLKIKSVFKVLKNLEFWTSFWKTLNVFNPNFELVFFIMKRVFITELLLLFEFWNVANKPCQF